MAEPSTRWWKERKEMTVAKAKRFIIYRNMNKADFFEEALRLAEENDTLASEVRRLRIFEQERNDLLNLTTMLEDHPEEYDGPCMCRTCLSYCDSEAPHG
jgi:hypothetical protein